MFCMSAPAIFMVGLTIVGVGLGLMLEWVISQMIGRSLSHLGKVVSKLERGDGIER